MAVALPKFYHLSQYVCAQQQGYFLKVEESPKHQIVQKFSEKGGKPTFWLIDWSKTLNSAQSAC